MTTRKYWIIFALLLFVGLTWGTLASAQSFDITKGIVGNLPYECRVNGNCSWCDFIDLFVVLQKVILSLFGGLALIMLIWGGQSIITAAGNSQKIAEAKKLIISTLFGVLIIMAGYFLINVVVGILASPKSATGQPVKPTSGILTWGSGKWLRAFCPNPSEEGYCQGKERGTPCGEPSGMLVCDGAGLCNLTSCSYLKKTLPSLYLGCLKSEDCTSQNHKQPTDDYCPANQVCCQVKNE